MWEAELKKGNFLVGSMTEWNVSNIDVYEVVQHRRGETRQQLHTRIIIMISFQGELLLVPFS